MKYHKYTKLNSTIKSATFELVPVGKTRDFLELHDVIKEDSERKAKVVLVKEVSDTFIVEFLRNYNNAGICDWENLHKIYNSATCTEIRGCIEKEKGKIAKDLNSALNAYIESFLKYNDINCSDVGWNKKSYVEVALPLYAKSVPDFNTDEYEDALASMKASSSAMFKKCRATYERIINGTNHGSIADRVIENFETFLANKLLYEKILETATGFENDETFTNVSQFGKYLSQNGIDKYNSTIGDFYNSSGELIKRGVNSRITEWNQSNPDNKLPKLQKLKKQILVDREKMFTIETIENKSDFNKTLNTVLILDEKITIETTKLLTSILAKDMYNTEGVYVTRAGGSYIANGLTGSWDYFEAIKTDAITKTVKDKLLTDYFNAKGKVKTNLTKADEKEIEKATKDFSYTIAELDRMLAGTDYITVEEMLIKKLEELKSRKKESYHLMTTCAFWNNDNKPTQDENGVIQKYLDDVLAVVRFTKIFSIDVKLTNADTIFMEDVAGMDKDKHGINKTYNMIRNYLTKKTELDAKQRRVQLCFGRPTHFEQKWNLMHGDKGIFGNCDAGLLEKDGCYYYIVPASKNWEKLNIHVSDCEDEADSYNMLSTKKGMGFLKMLIKCTLKSKSAIAKYKETDEPFELPIGDETITISKKMAEDYANKKHSKSKEELIKVIDFAKEFIAKHPSFKRYDLSSLKESSAYDNLKQFSDEVDSLCFAVTRLYVSKEQIDDAVEKGNLYMFMITSQDMYKSADKKHNIYSIRFNAIMKSMFEAGNHIIVNNSPSIYYRPALIEAEDKHPAGSILVNKLTTEGKTIPGEIYLELCAFYNGKCDKLSPLASVYNEKVSVKESTFPHIKDKHYTEEKFSITLSYKMNTNVVGNTSVFTLNNLVQEDIRENGCNIMSVIRGMDNLLYYCIVDSGNKRIASGNLNTIGNADYYEKLCVLGTQRYIDAKNWKYEKKVAELKETYLRQICRKIIKIAIENNAVICIDKVSDLRKNKLSAFDNQVYKKFENTLITALANYYDTSIPNTEAGGSLNPLQLAVEGADTMQNGILFHVAETNTRNICMKTGFINLMSTFGISTVKAKMEYLKKVSRIYYDSKADDFVFEFTWRNLGCCLKKDELPLYNGLDKVWQLHTHLTRLKWNKEKSQYEEIDGTELIKAIRRSHSDMIGKDIEVDMLSSKEIQTLYDVFILYANGFMPKEFMEDTSSYDSPIVPWSSVGRIEYDEMTAYQLCRKASLTMEKIKKGLSSKELVVYRTEWLNYLLEN